MRSASTTLSITRLFFKLPRQRVLFLLLLITPFITFFFNNKLLALTVALIFPSLLFLIFLKLLMPNIPLKQLMALVWINELLFSVGVCLPFSFSVLFSAALSSVITYLVCHYVFGFRIKSWVAVLLNITLYAVFLSVSGFVLTKPFSLLAQFLLSTIVFFSFLLTILYVINAPMRRLFHINTLDAFSQVVRNWLYEDEELMENLRAISKRITTYMKFFSLSYGGKRLVVLVPKIHFGPFGSLGGSDLPRKLERYGVITFHGAATHDEDPLEDVSRAIVEKLKTGEVSERTVKLFEGRAGNARARALHFGDFALLFLTRAPYTTEDISYDFGAYLELLAKDVLGVEVAVIDEHNAENDEVMVIQGVSEAGREYVEAVRNLKFVKDIQPLFGYRKLVVNNSTVGSIHVLVFGEREFNVVLLDGNGVDRETKRCLEQVFDVVATTDSHMHNKVKGVILPVRLTDEECSQVLKAVNVQLERLRASNLHTSLLSYKALGPQMSVELSTTIGVTFTLTKYLLPLFLLWATVAFILLFS